MKILSWILTVLSYVLGILFVLLGVFNVDDDKTFYIAFGIIVFFVVGFAAHTVLKKYYFPKAEVIKKDAIAAYFLSMPQYLIPIIAIGVILIIAYIVDYFVWCFTRRHYILEFLAKAYRFFFVPIWKEPWFSSIHGGAAASSDPNDSPLSSLKYAQKYKVVDKFGNERTLTETGRYLFDRDINSPFHDQKYISYVDNKGEIWRSYDEGETFIPEFDIKVL